MTDIITVINKNVQVIKTLLMQMKVASEVRVGRKQRVSGVVELVCTSS